MRPYNLATQERIVRGRMPTLEIINERFARLLRIGLFNFVRRTAEISVGPVRVVEVQRVRAQPGGADEPEPGADASRCAAPRCSSSTPSSCYLVIDNLFGGNGQFHTRVEGRDFTQTEQRIIQRMLDVVFEDLEKAWAAGATRSSSSTCARR